MAKTHMYVYTYRHFLYIFMYHFQSIRRDKLNSQFIVTKFSILHAGGRSLFRFQTSREAKSSARSPEPRPLIRALEMVECGPRYCIFTVLDLKSETFLELESENPCGR